MLVTDPSFWATGAEARDVLDAGAIACTSGTAAEVGTAAFASLLQLSLDAGGCGVAERRLREAEAACPAMRFAALCAETLGDAANPPYARQLSGLLLRRAFACNRPLAAQWPEEATGADKAALHAALGRAMQDADRAVWSAAAAAAGRIAALEVPRGLWPDFIPSLQRWLDIGGCSAPIEGMGRARECAADDSYVREAAMIAIKCLMEEWHDNGPTGRDGLEADGTMLHLLDAVVRGMDALSPVRVRVAAAEALLQIIHGTPVHIAALAQGESLQIEFGRLLEAVVAGCHVGAGPPELQMVSFHCLTQLCEDYYTCISPRYRDNVSSVGLLAVAQASLPVKVAAMDLWCVVANRQSSGDIGNDVFAANVVPTLVPAILTVVHQDDCDDESSSLLLPARACLAAASKAAPNASTVVLLRFISTHFWSDDLRLRRAALVAFGAVVGSLDERDVPSVSFYQGTLVEAMQIRPLCRAACWAVGRTLELQGSAIQDDWRSELFLLCLRGLREPECAEDFGYVLCELIASAVFKAAQFSIASSQILQSVAHAGSHGRGALFAALSMLVRRAHAECEPLFADCTLALLQVAEELRVDQKVTTTEPAAAEPPTERRVCWDGSECTFAEFKQYYRMTAERCWSMSPMAGRAEMVDGVARCLHELTERLGVRVESVAAPMMAHYVANLQVTCAWGCGLDEDTLWGIGAVANQLGAGFINYAGPNSPLWPLLLHGMGEHPPSANDLATWEFPQTCAASLITFCRMCDALGVDLINCEQVKDAQACLVGLLKVPHLTSELRALAVGALGRVVFALGGATELLPQVLESLHQAAQGLPASILVGRHRISKKCQESQAHSKHAEPSRELDSALLEAYLAICVGLRRTGLLVALRPQLPDLLELAGARTVSPLEDGARLLATRLLCMLLECFPEYRDNCCERLRALESPHVGDADAVLEHLLRKCVIK